MATSYQSTHIKTDDPIPKKVLDIEPQKMVKDVPELRQLCEEIRESRETEFEKKARISDVLDIVKALLEEIEVVDPDDPADMLLPTVRRYLARPWTWCRWMTAQLVSRYLDYHTAALQIQLYENIESKKQHEQKHWIELAVVAAIVILASGAIFLGALNQSFPLIAIASLSLVVVIVKLTDILWERHTMRAKDEQNKALLQRTESLFEHTKEELEAGYYDPKTIAYRFANLEKDGIYVNSFIFHVLEETTRTRKRTT